MRARIQPVNTGSTRASFAYRYSQVPPGGQSCADYSTASYCPGHPAGRDRLDHRPLEDASVHPRRGSKSAPCVPAAGPVASQF